MKVSHGRWNPVHVPPLFFSIDELGVEDSLAWAAGIYEGEGCASARISTSRNQNRRYPAIAVVSCDLDVLERFNGVVNCGKIYERKTKNSLGKKTCYYWQTGSKKTVIEVTQDFWPYLSGRRRQQILDMFSKCEIEVR